MNKKVVFLGMGGTIAGRSESAYDNVGYKAGQIGLAQLLAAIPSLGSLLAGQGFESEQVAQCDSKDMGHTQWHQLASRAYHHLAQPDVGGLVVTHGTDTLEETAFFLSCVLPASLLATKAVVLTSAMRPASSLAPDGPQNLLDAVAVALSHDSSGVCTVCAGKIHSARDVQKVHPYRIDAFDSGDTGPLGFVEEGRVRWVHRRVNDSLELQGFPLIQLTESTWPRVEIVMSHAGTTGAIVRAMCGVFEADPLRGLVVAGTGNGTVHADLLDALRQAQTQNIRIMLSTRCSQGCVVAGPTISEFESANGLSPVKARIALMLSLML